MDGAALFAAIIGFFRKLWEARHEWGPAAAVGYIQHLRQELARAHLNRNIERAAREETQRNVEEFEEHRSRPAGDNAHWLRKRAGLIDGNNL